MYFNGTDFTQRDTTMKKVIALLVVAGLASFAVASDANKTAPKADKNASKAK
jgi:hypothetical protein